MTRQTTKPAPRDVRQIVTDVYLTLAVAGIAVALFSLLALVAPWPV